MEKFQQLRQDALQKLKIADHMLIITYPLVKDNKLLIAVMENLFQAFSNAMECVLEYERLWKRIPIYSDSFEAKVLMFKSKCVPRYEFNPEFVNLMLEAKEFLDERKKANVEFSRKDKFVVTDNDYEMRTVSANDIKKHIARAKVLIPEIVKVTENDTIFR